MFGWLFRRSPPEPVVVHSVPPKERAEVDAEYEAKMQEAAEVEDDLEEAIRDMRAARQARMEARQQLLSRPDPEPT